MLQNTLQLYQNAFKGLSRSIWLLGFVYLINRSGAMVIPFMTVYMTSVLEFSFTQAGWVMSCFGIGSVLGSYIGGKLTDTIGWYRVMFWAQLLTGFSFLVLLYVHSFWGLCLTIGVLNTFADAFRPAAYTSIAFYSKPENHTRSFSFIRLAVNLGFSIGPALGGFLAYAKGYDWLFIIDGLTCIGAAIFFRLTLTDKSEETEGDHPLQLTEEEIQPVVTQKKAYKDLPYLFFVVMNGLVALAFMQVFFTLPVFFKQDMFLTESQIGLLMAMNGIIIVITEMPLIYLLEGKRDALVYVRWGTLFLAFAFFVFVPFPFWPIISILSILFFTIGEILKSPFTNTFAIHRSNSQNRGAYMGLFAIAFSFAHVFAPTLGFFIADQAGFRGLWGFLTIICFGAAFGYWALQKNIENHAVLQKSKMNTMN